MGWLEGILSGYGDRSREVRAEEMARAEAARAREQTIYEKLLEHTNPEIRALGAAGMLEMGQPQKRKGGFAGWIGQMEQSPAYGAVLRFNQDLERQNQEGLELPATPSVPPTSGALPGQPTPPAAPGSASLPSTSQVTGTPQTPVQPPPTFQPPPVSLGGSPGPAPAFNVPPVSLGARPAGPPAPPPDVGDTPGAAPPVGPPPPDFAAPSVSLAPAAQPLNAAPPPPPPPPGAGYPGGTIQRVGRPIEPPPRRTSLFPNASERLASQQRAQRSAQIQGDLDGYTQMYMAMGLSEPEARERAAELYEDVHVRAGTGALQQKPYALEYTDPQTGQLVQTMGYWDTTTRGYYDSQGRSLAHVNVTRATPTSVNAGGALRMSVMQAMGVTPAQVATDPLLAQEVNDRVTALMDQRIGSGTTSRYNARAGRAIDPQERFANENQLRTQWRVISTKLRDQQASAAQMKAAWQAAARGDYAPAGEAITVLYERTLDPDSVVREAEASRPAQFSGLVTRAQGMWQNWLQGGGKLPIEELAKYVQLAEEMRNAAAAVLEDERARIAQMATDYGLNPAHIVPPRLDGAPPAAGPAAPAPGPAPPAAPAAPAPAAATPAPAAPAAPGGVTLDTPITIGPDGKPVIRR